MSEEARGPALPPDTGRVVELIQRPGTAAVLVLGEMGVGKSALLDGACQQLATAMEPLRLHGSPALAKVPYGVLAPFLGGLPPEEAGSRVEVLRAFWRAVEELRHDRKSDLLLAIDDAHELDPASSEVVAELVSARWTKALVASPSGAALPRPLMELWLDGGVERVDLSPLTVDQVWDFIESAVGGRVLPSVPRLFWQESEGNPLVLGRLVDEARRAGSLSLRGSTWIITGELPHRGAGLLGLARAQLARLSAAEREALSLIVVAEPAPFELIERACGAEAIRRLVATRLVRPPEGPDGVLRLRHPVYGDALLSLIPLTTSLALRQHATAYMAHQTSTAQGLLRAVTWALDCGFPMEDATLLAAARLALRLFENALAVRAAGAVQDPRARLAAKEVLGQVAHSRGQYAEAVALLRPVAGRDGVLRPSLTSALVWIAARTALNHPPAAIRKDIDALPTSPVTDILGLVVDSLTDDAARVASGLARWRASPRAPLTFDDGSPEPTTEDEEAVGEVIVRSVEAELLIGSGRPRKARSALRGSLARAVEQNALTPYVQAVAAARLLMADLAAGEWDAAEEDVQRFLIASNAGLVSDGAVAETVRGLGLLRRGRFREALLTLAPAVDALRERDPQQVLPFAAAGAAYAGARLGKHETARSLLGQVVDHADVRVTVLGPLADLFAAAARDALDGAVRQVVRDAVAPLESDRFTPAAPGTAPAGLADRGAEGRSLKATLETFSGGDRLDLQLQGELLWLEAGRRDRLDRLLDVARHIEGSWAETAALTASALVDGTPEVLLEAGEALWNGGAVRYARECFADASRAMDRALRRAEARAAWARKTECDAILGDEGPASVPPDTRRLTRREREIVALAVAGLSDREIADRLTVSVRTVEGHLYRAYSKLDVTSREQLTSAMGRGRSASPGR
ncbi:LuxR C-terminal-related transcriptional regulator [Sinomonas notoginsengisoli]|uniref:helix-turn-helix transcriptional regulator n=1 Tax=Sinomonas notoginsengisoli TaxID=1457311 RepID=UPI001F17B565|nr:LuxR C-terminal-related transcriptional regulator [Sinomonas notoginsengisoli]